MRLDAEAPAGEIDVVGSVAAYVAVTERPVPVPVAVVPIWIERAVEGSGPHPQVIVHPWRDGRVGNRLAVGVALAVPSLGHLNFADDPLAKQFVSPLGDLTRPHLGPMLHDPVVLLGGVHQQPALAEDMTRGFLEIDVLARLHCSDCNWRMPVMRRRHDNGVDLLVVQDLAEVLDELRRVASILVDGLPGPFGICLVDVANRCDADIVPSERTLDVPVAHTPHADHGQHDFLVRRLGSGPDRETAQCRSDYLPPGHFLHGFPPRVYPCRPQPACGNRTRQRRNHRKHTPVAAKRQAHGRTFA